MKVQICTPEKKVTLEHITYVHLPAESGAIGILDHHAPMVITLKKGEIVFQPKGKLEIPGGTAFIKDNTVLIMTDTEVPNDL